VSLARQRCGGDRARAGILGNGCEGVYGRRPIGTSFTFGHGERPHLLIAVLSGGADRGLHVNENVPPARVLASSVGVNYSGRRCLRPGDQRVARDRGRCRRS